MSYLINNEINRLVVPLKIFLRPISTMIAAEGCCGADWWRRLIGDVGCKWGCLGRLVEMLNKYLSIRVVSLKPCWRVAVSVYDADEGWRVWLYICAGLILSACTHIHFCDSLLFEMCCVSHLPLLSATCANLCCFCFFLPAIEIWKL